MSGTRVANSNWHPGDDNGNVPTWERVQVAVLLDLSDELQKLNRLLHCHNFIAIPSVLREIRDRGKRNRSRYWRLREHAKAHRRSVSRCRALRRAA